MKKHFILVVASLLKINIAYSAAPPFPPQYVPAFDANTTLEPGYSRLKVNVSSDESTPENQVNVGNVIVCSDSACYRPQLPTRTINLLNTSTGTSQIVADMTVPNFTLRRVFFESVAGTKTINGDSVLIEPLALPREIEGGEILVILTKSAIGTNIVYQPKSSIGSIYSSKRQSVYYNPKFSTTASLGLHTLSIPAGALTSAKIFSVVAHNTGDQYPLFDIYPDVTFSVPASLSIITGPLGATTTTTRQISKTGTIRFDSVDGTIASPSSVSSSSDCNSYIGAVSSAISTTLSNTGAVYLSGCETKPPFVHIVVTNNYDGREKTELRWFNGSSTWSDPILELSRIESHAGGSQVVINGFTWVGDLGAGTGYGRAKGFVQQSDRIFGNNRINGGIIGDVDGNKIVFALQPGLPTLWKEGINPPLFSTSSGELRYPFSIGSSSTSIMKDGVCGGNTELSRWSAFGTTPSNRYIFVSSTSEGSTTAAELCAVFKSLGANWAARLDGSTAAGITIDGIRRNPITGANSFLYGPSRYVAYSFRVGYQSGIPAATPVVNRTAVPRPADPCAANPRLCL